jgi:hypothetical protein
MNSFFVNDFVVLHQKRREDVLEGRWSELNFRLELFRCINPFFCKDSFGVWKLIAQSGGGRTLFPLLTW